MSKNARRNAILTGASHGIGPYIARALAGHGVNLVLAARSTKELDKLAELISREFGHPKDRAGGAQSASGLKVIAATCDVTDSNDRLNLVRRAELELGQIDVLVNNAGLEEIIPFEKQDPEMMQRIILTNSLAPMLLTREVLPGMLARNQGHIINVASLAGRTGMPFGAVYSGSKGALAEWSISLSAELAGRGVSVSGVCPGFVSDTGMHARKGKPAPATLGEVSPQHVAEAVVRALESGHPEILVSARPIRLLMTLRAMFPRAAIGLARRSGVLAYLRALAGSDSARGGE